MKKRALRPRRMTLRNADGDVAFACSGPANENDVALRIEEFAGTELFDQAAVDRRSVEGQFAQLLDERHLGQGHLIVAIAGERVFDATRACLAAISA